jgi:intracellular septation protein
MSKLVFNMRLLFNLKFLLEAGPIIVFFATYKLSQSNILLATVFIMAASLVCLALRYLIVGNISPSLLFSSAILIGAGSFTLITGNTAYIKMKPTIVFGTFGLCTYIGVLFKKFFIKDIVESGVKLRYRHWRELSIRVSIYFLILAVINEITWRMLSEEVWVNFKIFGIGTLSAIFVLTQVRFIEKHKITGERR